MSSVADSTHLASGNAQAAVGMASTADGCIQSARISTKVPPLLVGGEALCLEASAEWRTVANVDVVFVAIELDVDGISRL